MALDILQIREQLLLHILGNIEALELGALQRRFMKENNRSFIVEDQFDLNDSHLIHLKKLLLSQYA